MSELPPDSEFARSEANDTARCELEQQLLGWMLSHTFAVKLGSHLLRSEAAQFEPPHDVIAAAIFAAHDAGRQVSARTIAAELRDNPNMHELGFDYLIGIARAAPAFGSNDDLTQRMLQTLKAWRRLNELREQGAARPGSVDLVNAATITPREIRWLWQGWLARGKFHVLAGSPGTGKTTLSLSFAATLSVGGTFPCGARAQRGATLLWSGEYDLADSILPRFLANGGDATRLEVVSGTRDEYGRPRPFDPAHDMEGLLAAARRVPDLQMLIVDPLISAVAGDSHRNAETRRALQPLVDIAQATDCAVLGISHYSKGTSGRDPAERVNGSLAFAAVPRLVMATGKPKERGDKWRLTRAKSNIGPDGGGFEYELKQGEVKGTNGLFAQHILWGDTLEGTAQSLLADVEQPEERSGGREAVLLWLNPLLAAGPVASKQIEEEARKLGFADAALRRAKKQLGVESFKTSVAAGGWMWRLPKMLEGAEGAHSRE